MPKASEVSAELRRIADALDKEPETDIQVGWLTFYCSDKEKFLATAKLLPRPLVKSYDDPKDEWARFHVTNGHVSEAKGLHVDCSIRRSEICRLVRPAQAAEYECEPLLSDAEEEAAHV